MLKIHVLMNISLCYHVRIKWELQLKDLMLWPSIAVDVNSMKIEERQKKTEKDRRKVRRNMTMNDPKGVRLNWLALWACVYGNVTITRALKCMGVRSCKTISQKDMQDLKHNKLSQSVGNKICEDYKTGNYTLREMAKRYKISYGSTYRIVKGTYKYESA